MTRHADHAHACVCVFPSLASEGGRTTAEPETTGRRRVYENTHDDDRAEDAPTCHTPDDKRNRTVIYSVLTSPQVIVLYFISLSSLFSSLKSTTTTTTLLSCFAFRHGLPGLYREVAGRV